MRVTLRAYHFAGKSAPFDMHTEEKLYHTFNVDVNHLPPPNGNQKLLARRSYGILIEHDFDNDRQRPGLLSFFYVENETCTGTATPYIINIPALSFPHLPTPNDVRPQMHKSMMYRGYAGAAAPAVEHGAKEQDPYGYDVPGFEQGPFNNSPPAGSQPPPPYSPVSGQQLQQPQNAKGSLPAHTDGTYSSLYEHTAAWVQGGGSQTTGSDTGGPSQKLLSAHQQAVYTPVQQVQPVQQAQHPQQTQQVQQAQQYSQPQQYLQAPVQQPQQQYVQAGYSAAQTQPPYSQPVVQTQQQEVPQSSSSHPTPQPTQQQPQQH